MTTNLLDLINAKLNVCSANVRATDEKLALETTTRENELAAATARVAVLEHDRDLMATELNVKQAALDALTGRVDALYAQLNQLGVTG